AKYAWSVLAYNMVVILLGAYVRASSSGAGCGSHWPLCNGEVIPRSATMKTLIEFSHRLTSGFALLLVIILFIWAFRAFARKHHARAGAALSLVFIITEALIGAGLVLLEYVAENKSMWRAIWMSGHLVNTFLLVAMLTFTAWAATTDARLRIRGQGSITWVFAVAIISTLILGVSGAITALGATLFPVKSIAEGLQQDFSPLAHQLTRLRVFHPAISIVVSGLLIYTARVVRALRPGESKLAGALISLIIIQLIAGVVNLILHAPIWLQIVHLLLSDFIWIALVLLAVTALAEPVREASFGVVEPSTAMR
ncbi:MAG: COX15/CtaA family protein, partial [Acidobacteria bacterium]|nr:COX15/CtaA family protein [Acidobacteriota bacterium]